jgi:protein-L-isoaspartate(D-aspartate) O-methyltransferase
VEHIRACRGRSMEDRSEKLRSFFASFICAGARTGDPRIEQAFAAVRREPFVGPGPWSILARDRYVKTPDDDPAFIYQDTLVALDSERGINNGSPGAHAFWLDALALKEGETVLQIGAGTGYYTAIIAHLVGIGGRVHAYEIDAGFAARASENLKGLPQVDVQPRSGIADDLPKADAIYVCASTTQPSRAWLDALRPGARLLFPLQPGEDQLGGMLLLKRPDHGPIWPAKFVSRAQFIGCVGLQEADAGDRLKEAFSKGWNQVRSFRIDDSKDDTCWFAGDGWWLSTAADDSDPPRAIAVCRRFLHRFRPKNCSHYMRALRHSIRQRFVRKA